MSTCIEMVPCSRTLSAVFLLIMLGVAIGGRAQVLAQEPEDGVLIGDRTCRDTTISGRVAHGAAFQAAIRAGLILRLDPGSTHPRNPQGWTIRVTPSDAPDADYSKVVTPPYRFNNARYVDTGYGNTAEQALAWTPRRFRFVADEHAYKHATESLRVLLWSGEHTDEEISQARAIRNTLRAYEGIFMIVDGAVSREDGQGSRSVIDWMSFRAEVCIPEP